MSSEVSMCKYVAYLRVSTDSQDIENQRHEITRYTAANNIQIDDWIEAEVSSRKSLQARKIDETLSTLKRGDTLIVSEISRLARSMRELQNILFELEKKKVSIHIIKQGIRTNGENDLTTKILFNAFGMAAELEKELISQRTKAALAARKAQGKKLGNPNLAIDNAARIQKAKDFAERMKPIIMSLKAEGLPQRAIADRLNALNIPTPTGRGKWHLCSVQNLQKYF